MAHYIFQTPKSCCYECEKANRPACRKDCPEWAAHEAEKAERYSKNRIRCEADKNHRRVQP